MPIEQYLLVAIIILIIKQCYMYNFVSITPFHMFHQIGPRTIVQSPLRLILITQAFHFVE